MANDLVQPTGGAAPAPVEVEPTEGAVKPPEGPPTASGENALPEPLLRIPAFQGLIAGQPAAISADIKTFASLPEAKLIAENAAGLERAGIGRYRSLGGDLGVLFNYLYITPEELKAADAAGKLAEVAPPFDVVNQQIATSGENNPVLKHSGQVPESFKQAAPPVPPQALSPGQGGLAPGAQKALTIARAKNLQAGQPTEGPKPVQGRILNNVLKSPV